MPVRPTSETESAACVLFIPGKDLPFFMSVPIEDPSTIVTNFIRCPLMNAYFIFFLECNWRRGTPLQCFLFDKYKRFYVLVFICFG